MKINYSEKFKSSDTIPKHEMEIVSGIGGIDIQSKGDDGFFKIFSAFIKKIGHKILKGKFNFSSMQRPSLISQPVSHCQLIANEYCLLVDYIKEAIQQKDAYLRLQLITAGLVGNISYNIYKSKGKGPVNPILGETYSGSQIDGTRIFIEQVSMNPHSTLIYIIGPNEEFKFSALVRVK